MTINGKQITEGDNLVLSALCFVVQYNDEHPGFIPIDAREQYLRMALEIIERIKRNEQANNNQLR